MIILMAVALLFIVALSLGSLLRSQRRHLERLELQRAYGQNSRRVALLVMQHSLSKDEQERRRIREFLADQVHENQRLYRQYVE